MLVLDVEDRLVLLAVELGHGGHHGLVLGQLHHVLVLDVEDRLVLPVGVLGRGEGTTAVPPPKSPPRGAAA